MKFLAAIAVAAAILSSSADTPDKPKERPRSTRAEPTSITGCVDQRDETYILTRTDTMRAEAILKGRSFTDDNFARFLGTKATVYGQMQTERDQQVIYVTRIDKVSDSCH